MRSVALAIGGHRLAPDTGGRESRPGAVGDPTGEAHASLINAKLLKPLLIRRVRE